jgi:hypothetical protein
MRQCPQCGGWCDRGQTCSRCGLSSDGEFSEPGGDAESASDAWAAVARFGNAAEAGYFANELDYVLGVEPRLDCRDDFDAVHHHWRSGFVLSVPDQHADRAREVLTRLLDGDSPEPAIRDEDLESAVPFTHSRLSGPAAVRPSGSHVKWAPLFLTLAAGSLAFWHGKKPPVQRQPPPPRDALRIHLRETPGLGEAPWIQIMDGGARRELHFPDVDGEATLREDRDGDGVFEREYTIETR